MRYKRRYGAESLLAVLLSWHWGISLSDEVATNTASGAERQTKVWAGYCEYRMHEFNRAQAADGNRKLKGGFDAGLEFSPFPFKAAPNLPLIGGANFSIPLAFDYSHASIKTTHTDGANSASVAWDLPLIGVYVAPEIALSTVDWLTFQPIGVGYYSLGELLDANLTISDRAGRMRVKSGAVAALSGMTIKPFQEKNGLFVSLFYRWLSFTNVRQEPKDGFQYAVGATSSPPGNLQQELDYSGFVVKIGIAGSF
jgi:hypothetical protein